MKKTRMVHFTFLIFIIFVFNFMGCNGNKKVLNVQLYAQQTELWCWAAGGEMIMCSHGKKVSQGKQVNDCLELEGIDCSDFSDEDFGDCIRVGIPDYERYGFYVFTYIFEMIQQIMEQSEHGEQEPWRIIINEIDNKRAAGFAWGWNDGDGRFMGGHYMVAKGYHIDNINNTQWVVINDPLPMAPLPDRDKKKGGHTRLITYSEFLIGTDHILSCIDQNIYKQ